MRAAAALPIEVEIDRPAGIPNDVAGGLDTLAMSPPLWPVDGTAWLAVVERVRAFACRWDVRARTAGWSALELYGLHRWAPYANLAGMGGAFVVARCGHHVIDVAADAIQVRSPSGADLRIYRRELGAQSVLAWYLVSDDHGQREAELEHQTA